MSDDGALYRYRLPTPTETWVVPEDFTTVYHPPGTEPDIPPLPDDLAAARAEVERIASDDGKYKQYVGHFADWQFATANREIRGSWDRLVARTGERILASLKDCDRDYAVVFSRHGSPGSYQVWAYEIDFDDEEQPTP